MTIKVNKFYPDGEIKPIEHRICVNCSNNENICNCSIYAGNEKLENNFKHI